MILVQYRVDLIEPRISPRVILHRIDDASNNTKHLKSLCRNCKIQLELPNSGMPWSYLMYYCNLFYGCRVFKYIDRNGSNAYFNLEDFTQKMYSQTYEENIELCKGVLSKC